MSECHAKHMRAMLRDMAIGEAPLPVRHAVKQAMPPSGRLYLFRRRLLRAILLRRAIHYYDTLGFKCMPRLIGNYASPYIHISPSAHATIIRRAPLLILDMPPSRPLPAHAITFLPTKRQAAGHILSTPRQNTCCLHAIHEHQIKPIADASIAALEGEPNIAGHHFHHY